MPNGYTDRILRVNLSNRTIAVEEMGDAFHRRYLGGVGFVSYFLLKELRPGVDPLGPENLLVFAPGVVTGAPFSGNARNCVGARSPMSGAIGRTEVGGYFGPELKHAGFDAVLVEGQADRPVYLWIHDGEVEVRDASRLWGLDTKETQEAICTELGDPRIRFASIGKGGENLVRYACVINDLKSAAGRTGMGAVMGSKKLKAIAVRGHKMPPMADADQVKALAKWAVDNVGTLIGGMTQYGTGSAMGSFNQAGNLPTRNFRDGYFEGIDNITAQAVKEKIRIDMETCYACAVRCKKVVRTPEPFASDPAYGGPEYETLASFGSNCGVDNLNAIARAHHLCNAYALDTISAGATIAFAMECYENGLLTQKDTDGIDLRFGNAEAMIQVLEKIACREGIGNLLAEGTLRAAQQIGQGAEQYAVHGKGVEMGMHEPRLKFGLGLGYAVAAHGGDHCIGYHDTNYDKEKVSGWPSPGSSLEMKALGLLDILPANDLSPAKVAQFVAAHNWRTLNDAMVLCINLPYTHQQTADLVNAITGWTTTVYELMKVGERVVTMMRAYNLREGLTSADDKLPPRFFQPTTRGALQNQAQDPATLERAKGDYYALMGWDVETGIPGRAKLGELGIGWVEDELAGSGKAAR